MLMRIYISIAFLCLLVLPGCRKAAPPPAQAAHATVMLRDGSQVSGTVTAASPSEVTLNLDNNGGSRTIGMSQVSSISYDQVAAAQPAAATPPAEQPAAEQQPPASAPAEQPAPPAPAPAASAPAAQAPPESGHERHYHPERSAIRTATFVVPAGTQVRVRTEETIDSARAVAGQTYAAEVASDVRDAAGAVVIPRGANAQLVIRSASGGGHVRGASDLILDLQSVSVEGQRYRVETAEVAVRGRSGLGRNKRTGEFVGGGAAFGAIVGAIAGHGAGAAIGAASGAGAGAVTQVLTKGSIRVPVESILTFRLERSLRIVQAQ